MKRKIIRILVALIITSAVGAAVVFAILLHQESSNRDPYTVIPEDAIFLIRSDNLSRGWEELTGTKFWKTLEKTEHYENITNTAASLDSIIQKNKTVYRLLEDRPVMVSAHMTSTYDYKMLITADLLKASKVVFLKDFAFQILKLYGYDFVKMDYNEHQLIEVVDKDKAESFYMSFIDNIMVVSFSQEVVKKAIDQKPETSLANNKAFNKAKNNISSVGLLRFYFNYSKLEDFIRVYQNPAEYRSLIDGLNAASFSAFDFDVSEHQIVLEGQTSYRDSISPYLQTVKQIRAEKPSAFRVVPKQSAVYLSFAFHDFSEFHSILKKQYIRQDSSGFAKYEKSINQLNKILNTDVEKHLSSWIGNEIAFIKLQPNQKTKIRNAVVCVHAEDIDNARKELSSLNDQIKKNLPAGFKAKQYHGYPVHYLNISGIFRFMFSDLLSKIDKPYYTFINDYVVFSNSITDIYRMIDAYVREQTLIFDDSYMDFVSEVHKKAPLSVYVNTPNAMKLLYSHANTRTKGKLNENNQVISSFSRIGLQFIPGSETIKTNLVISHDENALFKTRLQELETEATELYSLKLQAGDFLFKVPEEQEDNSTFVTLYYEDSVSIKAKGKLKRGRPHENWRLFYRSGNVKAMIPFKRGDVEGKAFFYHDVEGQPLLCEAEFDNNELDGSYKEYYKNGKLKASLSFRNNEEDGKAKFYYPSETIKIKGNYKDGSKKGSWKYYAPDGQEFDKKYWKTKNQQ